MNHDHESTLAESLLTHGGFFLRPILAQESMAPVVPVIYSAVSSSSVPITDTGAPVEGEVEQSEETGSTGIGGNDSGPSGKLWRAVIIESGISANNNYYSPDVLRASIKLAENCPIRIYFFDGRSPNQPGVDWNDHMPQLIRRQVGGRVVANTVGFFNNVRFEQVQSTRTMGKVWALTGDANITDPRLQANLLNTWRAGGMNPNASRSVYELSIEAIGPSSPGVVDGRRVNVVNKIVRYEEVTIVSEAAAGGMFERLVASATDGPEAELSNPKPHSGLSDPEISEPSEDWLMKSPDVIVAIETESETESETVSEGNYVKDLHKKMTDLKKQQEKDQKAHDKANLVHGVVPWEEDPKNYNISKSIKNFSSATLADKHANKMNDSDHPLAGQFVARPFPKPKTEAVLESILESFSPDLITLHESFLPHLGAHESLSALRWVESLIEGRVRQTINQLDKGSQVALNLAQPAQPAISDAPDHAGQALGVGLGDPLGAIPYNDPTRAFEQSALYNREEGVHNQADELQKDFGIGKPSTKRVIEANGLYTESESELTEAGSGTAGSIGIDLSMVPSSEEYLSSPALSADLEFAPIKQAIFQCCQFLRAGDLESAVQVLERILKNKEEDPSDSQKSSSNSQKSSKNQKNQNQPVAKTNAPKPIAGPNAIQAGKTVKTQQESTVTEGAKNMPNGLSAAERYGSRIKHDQDERSGGYVTREDLVSFRNEIKEAVQGIGQYFAESNLAAQTSLQSVTALQRSNQLSECKSYLTRALKESGLPDQAQGVIRKKYSGQIFDMDELKESIQDARTMISSVLAESPRYPSNGRAPVAQNIQFGKSRLDYEKARLDLAFGYDPRKDWNNLTESARDTYRHASRTPPSIARWFEGWYDDSVHNLGTQMGRNALYLEAQSQPYIDGFLSEAVSTDLPALLGDSQTRALMQAYKTQAPMWRNISDVVPVANFKTQRRILLGALGKLPVVTQGDNLQAYNYGSLGYPQDEERDYGIATRGGIVVVTRQMIINDDLQGIQAFPKKIGEAAVSQLNELVFKCLQGATGGTVNGDLSYDGLATYRNGFNLYTSALAYAPLVDAIQNLSEVRQFANISYLAAAMTDTTTGSLTVVGPTSPGTLSFAGAMNVGDTLTIDGEELTVVSSNPSTNVITVTRGANGSTASTHLSGARVEQLGPPIAPDNLWVVHPNTMRSTVKELLASALRPDGSAASPVAGSNAVNALFDDYQEQRILPLPVHSMYLSGDKKSWWLAVNKPIEVGFLGGKEDPQLFLQDNPLVGPVFNGDQITWKVRHEYGYVLKDHRMVAAGIVP